MNKEIELKYRLDEAMIPPLLSDPVLTDRFTAPLHEIRMESIYFDTPSRVLHEKRITFRRRLENDAVRFTVKTPSGAHERGEWEVSADSIEEALSLFPAVGAPQLPDPPYLICAQAKFLRRTTRIKASETAEFELCIDVGTLGSLPFCELELELKKGSKEELEQFGAELASRFGLIEEPLSKFARAKISNKR